MALSATLRTARRKFLLGERVCAENVQHDYLGRYYSIRTAASAD